MRNIHIVSHTHWDREWYRPFQLFRLKLVHLIDGVLRLLEADPQFKFFMLDGQTIVLDDYLALRPENEAILRQHIQKGRIIIGPWHILPDMFLVGPEAHIRNLLQGDQTSARFGRKMMIGYIPDPFGHPGQVPQILNGFGIETACLWRGLDEEPVEFWWQAPDGSKVLMLYLRDSYSNGASLPANNPTDFARAVALEGEKLAAHSAVSDLLVMYGTDHMEPPVKTAAAIAYADKNLPGARVLHSTLPKYAEAVRAELKKNRLDLPTVAGELRNCRRMHLLPGVLSTRMWIKQRNHASENLLLKWAEPFSTFADLAAGERRSPTALDHPAELVRQAWRMLMENHPHDSICGCSIDQVHEEMKARFDQVDQVGEELVIQSLDSLAANINTATGQGQSAVVIFNPLSQPRTDLVQTTLELPGDISEFDLVDEKGTSVPYQAGGTGSHEVVNMTMDVKEFQIAFGFINDGRASGMSVQALSLRLDNNEVFIEAVVTEGGEPNMTAWKAGRKQADEYLANPAIKTYHVRALSVPAAQVAFTARDVPAHGYQTLWVRPRQGSEKPAQSLSPWMKALLPLARLPFIKNLGPQKRYARPPYIIENGLYKIELRGDATITLTDKRAGISYTGLNRFQDGGDCGDEYNYSPPETDAIFSARLNHVRIQRGPVRQTMEVELELGVPAALSPDRKARSDKQVTLPIISTISLTEGVARVDIHTTADNAALDHRLRVHFPAPFSAEVGYYDGHFEVVERKIGVPAFDDTWIEQPRPEVPQRAFTDLTDGKKGLMLANRGLPEVEVLKNSAGNDEIALTLLRCVGWLSRDDFATRKGHAGPYLETPGAQMQGRWSFDYSIIPHNGNWQAGGPQAYAFETPLRAVNTGLHEGTLPPSTSFVSVEPATFVITSIKQSQDLRGWLVRGVNLTGEEITVRLNPMKSSKAVELVNLAEQKLAGLKPGPDGTITLQVRGHEIASVLFKN